MFWVYDMILYIILYILLKYMLIIQKTPTEIN